MRRHGFAALACLSVATGCQGDRSMFIPANDRARQLAQLGWVVLVGFTVVSLGMWAILAWASRRRAGTFDEHAPVELDDGKGWMVVGGILIPVFVFLALLIVSVMRMTTARPVDHHAAPMIRVIGHRWWWEVQYVTGTSENVIISANEIHIPTGWPMTIELRSEDVIHSFWVPNLQGKIDLVPGHVNDITITADQPGVYLGQCAEFCGLQHANMKLAVIAHTPADFQRWRAHELAPAAPPTTRDAIAGEQVFEAKPCAMCHTIRGTHALGHIGPDLTHLASRRTFAANMLPMDRAYLAAWSTRAHSLKPGVEMPDLAAMTGEELDQLVTYLLGLK